MDMNNDAPVCPDWVWLNLSNVHIAKDRGWFKTYTPFASTIQHSVCTSPNYLQVLGIGTVEIPTKRSPNLSGVSSHGSLHLNQVLHVPDFICNVIGDPIFSDGYHVTTQFGPKKLGTIRDSLGNNMAYFDPNEKLFSVKVRSQPGGPELGLSALGKDTVYMIRCQWDASEQQRWLEHQARYGVDNPEPESSRTTGTKSQYTDVEKRFLESTWPNEHDFLLQYGLKIHKEDDRAEGRSILRALMYRDRLGGELPDEKFS